MARNISSNIYSIIKEVGIDNKSNIIERITSYLNELNDNNVISLKNRNKQREEVVISDRCLARKQGGFQCTKRKQEGCEYCGGHKNTRPYGRIDEEYVGPDMNNDNCEKKRGRPRKHPIVEPPPPMDLTLINLNQSKPNQKRGRGRPSKNCPFVVFQSNHTIDTEFKLEDDDYIPMVQVRRGIDFDTHLDADDNVFLYDKSTGLYYTSTDKVDGDVVLLGMLIEENGSLISTKLNTGDDV